MPLNPTELNDYISLLIFVLQYCQLLVVDNTMHIIYYVTFASMLCKYT